MKEYEIVCKYINGCAGEAYPQTTFEEVMTPHGGGDYAMFDQIFGAGGPDPLGQVAGSRAGALSALVGITANESIASGKQEMINF